MGNLEITEVIIVCVVVFLLFGKHFLRMAKSKGEKMTEKDILQQKVNRIATGSDEERYMALGKTAHDAVKKKSGLGWLILLIIIIIVLLLLFSQLEIPSL